MAALKSRTKTYQVVDYSDLNAFVEEITGREWHCVAAGEWGNDSEHEIHATGLDSDWDRKEIEQFLTGNPGSYPYPQVMLDWLVTAGHILPGNYLIEVMW